MTLAALACFCAAAAVTAAAYFHWRAAARAWLPAQLKAARLVRVEEDLVADVTLPVLGRADQVYREASGLHIPVELKHRERIVVYDTDVAEVSLRAWLLRQNGLPTAQRGFVVISVRGQRERRAIEVDLLDDAACEALIERYIDLIEARRRPRRSPGPKCKTCGHVNYCH